MTSCCEKPRRRSRTLKVDIGLLADKIASSSATVVAYGVGTDSTAMIIELVRRKVKIDAILFADTEGELPRTYHYREIFSLWLEKQGYPKITTVRNIPTRGPNKGIAQGLFSNLWRNQALPPVAFNMHTCSERFKIRPQDRHVRTLGLAKPGQRILKLIGFDFEEAYRVNRTHPLIVASGEFEAAYPLIEWKWNREKCEQVILEAGLPLPGKSACFFCPMRKPHEIEDLKREEPELYRRALELEARALASGKIKSDAIKGLGGRAFAWKDLK